MIVPTFDLNRVADAHDRFLNAIRPLSDEAVARPSLLPGWSVGHVLTHVARNAQSHVRRANAAIRGEVIDQYEGGYAKRNADIEAGANRSAAELIEDVRQSAAAVDETWRDLPSEAWTGRTRDANGKERPLFELPSRRWQEVEVHLVDLNVGVFYMDWPDDFVLEWLPRTREKMWDRLPTGPVELPFVSPAEELAWFYGRLHRDDLPALPPWG